MRLIKRDQDGTLTMTGDLLDQNIPKYVILSHTWGAPGQEVTLQDFLSHTSEAQTSRKAGYKKIEFCSKQAAEDGFEYFWIDTCCIDKTNNSELTEAITSMFRWYQRSARCYVYLSDVKFDQVQQHAWKESFVNSRWFTRGWTLQELLAPISVDFFSLDGIRLGNKLSLEEDLCRITGIAAGAFRGRPLSEFSVSERMSWAAKRETTRKEDEAYSLLGLFGVYMPLIYGEKENAMARLYEQIDKASHRPSGGTSVEPPPAFHPVKKNYRQVHVTILYWEADELHDTVQRISDIFSSMYHYQVRQIPLPHRHKVDLSWPWLADSVVDDRDLQIMYYLGSTINDVTQTAASTYFEACPAKQLPLDEIYPNDPNPSGSSSNTFPKPSWLSYMLHIPELTSDVFIILDCFVESLTEPASLENINYLLDDDNAWARYLILFAGYASRSNRPGKLSDWLMSLLEELANPKKHYAREGLIKSRDVREKLEKRLRFNRDLNLHWFGNDGKDFIHLAPLPALENDTA